MSSRSTKVSGIAITIGLAATLKLLSGCTNPSPDSLPEQSLSCTRIERDKRELNFSVVWHDRASAYENDLQANVGVFKRATLTESEVAAVESRFTESLLSIYEGNADRCEPDHALRYVLTYYDTKLPRRYLLCISGDNQLDHETQYTLDDLADRAEAILQTQ
jgi:hypothetical protein